MLSLVNVKKTASICKNTNVKCYSEKLNVLVNAARNNDDRF